MYESTINIEIVKDGSPRPLSFLYSLQNSITATGTISDTISVNGMWINNTLSDKIISTIDITTESQELTEYWTNSIQEKAEVEGFTVYISVSGE